MKILKTRRLTLMLEDNDGDTWISNDDGTLTMGDRDDQREVIDDSRYSNRTIVDISRSWGIVEWKVLDDEDI